MEWISVKDRLPEGKCLVKIDGLMLGLDVHSANFERKDMATIAGIFEWDLNTKVTHWMPIDELPKQ